MASIKKNFALSSAYQILSVITPIITTPFLSRVIGAEGNGTFAFTQSVSNYFVLFAVLGMSSYGVRTIAECGDDRERRSRAFWNAFSMNAAVGIIVLICYAAYIVFFSDDYAFLYCIWGLWVVGSVFDVSWLLFGLEEFGIPTARNFITKIGSVLVILLFVKGPGDVWVYVLAIAGSNFANSVLVWPFVSRYVDFVVPTKGEMIDHLKPNLILFVPVIAISLYSVLDKIMLGAMAPIEQTGYFDYSEKISKLPMAIITALGSAVLPRMTAIISAGKTDEGKSLVETTLWFMLVCAFALCFGIIGVAPSFCPFFFGEGFDVCVGLMSLLALVIPTVCATNVIGNQYLLPCHRDLEYTVSVAAGAAVNLFLNVLLISRFGALGAAIGSVACEATVLVVQILLTKSDFNMRALFCPCFPYLVAGVLMSLLIRFIDLLVRPRIGAGPSLFVEFACGAAFYGIAVFVWASNHDGQRLCAIFPSLRKKLS